MIVYLLFLFALVNSSFALECSGDNCTCPSGETVNRNRWCDGKVDCSDQYDEADETCKFVCNDTANTIVDRIHSGFPAQVCDGVEDCPNGDDEMNCEFTKLYTCGDGHVITQHQLCDSINDCADGLDEFACNQGCENVTGGTLATTTAVMTTSTNTETTSTTTTMTPETPIVDQTTCESLDPGYDWRNRTKFIWNTCLIVSTISTTYEIAMQSCNQFANGHLVIIDTPEKEAEFHNTLVADWGGTDVWTFWIQYPLQPIEDPAYEVQRGPGVYGNSIYAYVCQYDAIDACKELGIENDETLPIGDSCFEMSTYALTSDNAATECTKHASGHLANLDASQIAILAASGKGNIDSWYAAQYKCHLIGLSQQLPAQEPDGGWNWLLSGGNKQPATDIYWKPGQPDNYLNGDHCGCFYMGNSNGLSDIGCQDQQPFICQYHIDSATTPAEQMCTKLSLTPEIATVAYAEESGDEAAGIATIICNGVTIGQFICTDGVWIENCGTGSSCWSYLSDVSKGYYNAFPNPSDFDQAKVTCAANCGQLITVHSADEANYAVEVFQGSSPDPMIAGTWIGMTRGQGGGTGSSAQVQWIDGTPVTYQGPYLAGEPSCDGCSDCQCTDCMEILVTDSYSWTIVGRWNDLPCSINTSRATTCAFYIV